MGSSISQENLAVVIANLYEYSIIIFDGDCNCIFDYYFIRIPHCFYSVEELIKTPSDTYFDLLTMCAMAVETILCS